MKAYLDNTKLKTEFVAEIEKHRKQDQIRFWSKVDKTASCWNWTAASAVNVKHSKKLLALLKAAK